MNSADNIKKVILSSKKAAAEDMAAIHSQSPLTKSFFSEKLRGFVLHKFMLKEEDLASDDFNSITELSLSKSMKISPELVKEFDLAKSCDGVSSAMAKKVLLFMAIQRELGIQLPAMASARITTIHDLAELAWNEMCSAESWEGRLENDQPTRYHI